MDNPFKSPAVISFCPGILGLERGLKRTGINLRVVVYVEIEAFIVANLVAGMEAGLLDTAPIWTDAKTFDARPFRGRIHAIIGGYPCTPFSLAGTRSGEDHPGHIYPVISRAIEAARPIWCFFENVDDHLTLGFDKVYQDLQRMGYSVEAGIYSAEEVGAPHERKRLFILAVANCYSYGYGTGAEGTNEKGCSTKKEAQRKTWNDILRQWMWDVVRNSSKELENSPSFRRWGFKGTQIEKRQQESRNAGQLPGGFEGPGNDMADSTGIGIQRNGTQGEQITDLQAGEKISGCDSGRIQWPTRPDRQQNKWEEPRTIESSMGCTINGYNFREDLLRALGNSVVEQTAELAFIDLLCKHLRNIHDGEAQTKY